MGNGSDTYYFYLINKQKQSKHKVLGNFSVKEFERLVNYSNYAQDLSQTKFINSKITFNLKWAKEKESEFSCEIPSDEVISTFLIKIRPFILIKELTYFYSICNILSKNMNNKTLNLVIKDFRDYYSGRHFQKQITFKINSVILNSEKTLQDWLNAYIYHRDKKKYDKLEKLHKDIFPLKMSKALWLLLFQDQAKAIIELSSLISTIRKEK